MCPKEKTLESHIIYLFPRKCLHFSGERKTVLTGEKVHLEHELGSHRGMVGANASFGVGQVIVESGNTEVFSRGISPFAYMVKENHKHF